MCCDFSCGDVCCVISASPLIVGGTAIAVPIAAALAGLVSTVCTVALLFFLAKSAWLGCKSLCDPSLDCRATLIGTGHLLLLSIPVIGPFIFWALYALDVEGFEDSIISPWADPFGNFIGDACCCCCP